MERWLLPLVISACFLAPSARQAEAGITTYLSIGDSLAFGVEANDTSTDISNGDRGYVSDFATTLAARNGNVLPNVINLGVSGETSSSFFGTGVGLDGPGASARNTNYTGTPLPSQDALMLSEINSQIAAGNTISTVTVALGANDLFVALALGTPFAQALATFQANELTLLNQIRGRGGCVVD
jgi:lysophospholipase L1-like esterase